MRRILVLISCIFIMSLCGCYTSKDAVPLDSEKKLMLMAQKKHGPVELVETQNNDGPERSRICELKDVKRGFTYHITSQPHSQGLDGAVFYYDGTMVTDDFDKSYLAWMKEVTKKEFEAEGFVVLDDFREKELSENGVERAVYLDFNKLLTTKDRMEEDLELVIRIMQSHDPELAMKYKFLNVYCAPEMEYVGQFTFDEILDDNVVGLRYMKKQVKKICGIDIDGFDRVTDIRADRVPGLEEQKLDRTSLKSDDLTRIYYFTYEGQEYFICEAKVYRDAKGGEALEYYQNYTN